MKNKILILLISIALTSCLDQDKDGCPADMYLTFSIDDPHEPDVFDSRLGGDVMLYIFKDKQVVSGTLIPYEKISGGKEYVIRKDENHSGNLDLVAWAVRTGADAASIPQLSPGDNLYDVYRRLRQMTRAETEHHPSTDSLHVARITTVEAIDEQTRHELGLNYSDCRVEVRVTDNDGVLSQPGSDPCVRVYGTMTDMNMDRRGDGSAATVCATLGCPSGDKVCYTTGRFGVMPSAEGQTVSVKVYDGSRTVATLDVPQSLLPEGAVSGGLLIFEYTLNAPQFTVEVDGFRHNVVIIDDM